MCRVWRKCPTAFPKDHRWGPNSLAIVAKQLVEVRECDRCGKEPAHTWTITGPEGAIRETELCERHGGRRERLRTRPSRTNTTNPQESSP
jgi:hypothetical protein